MLRCYTSRVENGHTVPAIETLEKYARAIKIPMYKLFYDGDKPQSPKLPHTKSKAEFGAKGKESNELRRFAKLFSKINERDRQVLLKMAFEMARKRAA